ncbi:hypothetical protein ABZ915_14495 [Streptomyces sp. NPDC046915]|uniref:hypothetical protein n=1 Tax=Streptomyces sp. NPDC046915 TaxID=3155257 RepID=UPI0033C78B41
MHRSFIAILRVGIVTAIPLGLFGVTGHLTLADIASPGDGMDVVGALGAAIVGVGVGVGASFAMLVVVMRSLLLKATDLQNETAEVV